MTYETCKKADCTGCTVCPGGIAQAIRSDDPSTRVVNQTGVPEGVKGWCWGGFLMSWIWAIGNRTWIGLLSAIPYVGLAVAIWLGITDRAPAWIGLLGVTPFVGLGVTIWLGIKGRERTGSGRLYSTGGRSGLRITTNDGRQVTVAFAEPEPARTALATLRARTSRLRRFSDGA